jgi:hypothetical protein
MKTLRRIQNIVIIVAMVTALSLADGRDVSGKDLWSCVMILVLVVMMIAYRVLNEEKNKEEIK